MKDSVVQFILIGLSVVFLVSFIYTVMPTVKMGRTIYARSEKVVEKQIIAEKSLSLTSLAYQNEYTVMPMATLLSIYYNNQDYIYNVYDGRTGDSNLVEDVNDEGKAEKTVKILNKDVSGKVKVVIKSNTEHTGMYDIYIHLLNCQGETDHTGKCEEQ